MCDRERVGVEPVFVLECIFGLPVRFQAQPNPPPPHHWMTKVGCIKHPDRAELLSLNVPTQNLCNIWVSCKLDFVHWRQTDAQTLSCFECSGCMCAALSGNHVTLFHFNNLFSSDKGKDSPSTGLRSQMLHFLTNEVSTIPMDCFGSSVFSWFTLPRSSVVNVKHLFCAVSVLGLMLSVIAPSKSCKISVSDSN